MQAVVNGFILFEKWRALTIAKVDERIADMLSQKKNIRIQLRLKARLEQLQLQTILCLNAKWATRMRAGGEIRSASGTQFRGQLTSGSIKASKGLLSASIVPMTRSSVRRGRVAFAVAIGVK